MKIITIVCASALRMMIFMLIAIVLGSFFPIIIAVLLSCIIKQLTFYDVTNSEFFIGSITIGIIISLFWIGNKVDNYTSKKLNYPYL